MVLQYVLTSNQRTMLQSYLVATNTKASCESGLSTVTRSTTGGEDTVAWQLHSPINDAATIQLVLMGLGSPLGQLVHGAACLAGFGVAEVGIEGRGLARQPNAAHVAL